MSGGKNTSQLTKEISVGWPGRIEGRNNLAVSGGYGARRPERAQVVPSFRRQSKRISSSKEDSLIRHRPTRPSETDEVCPSMTEMPALYHHQGNPALELACH